MMVPIVISVILFGNVYGVAANKRIAGGQPAALSDYPHASALLTNRGSGFVFTQACGGTILTNTAILSAASCFFPNATADEPAWWRARVGSESSTSGGIIHLIRLITAHPQFSAATLASDVAVLRTSMPITLVAGRVQAASLGGGAFSLTTNQPILAIGWGLTTASGQPSEELREVQFWVLDHQTCTNRYVALGFTVTSDMVCTGWLDVGVRAQCQGDAGSPIMVDGLVVGVHSWAEDCADGWYPGINTLLAPFTSWVVDTAVAA